MRARLIIIVGPTAIGKTEVAISLAREWNGEIISADSMQVYRLMDIGTAKPSVEERTLVKHHLIDLVNPDAQFNAAMFIETAQKIIRELHSRRKPIFVVGGTGLYIKALLGGLFKGPDADEGLRKVYRHELKQFGKEYLYDKLKEKDKRAAATIDKNDVVRIIRALEVLELSGESIVEKQKAHKFSDNLYDCTRIGLTMDRSSLYKKIDQRTEKMIRDGLVDEVQGLLSMGYRESLKPMQSLGYKHIIKYIKGSYTLEDAVRIIKRDTRHYAKRQMTWFGADKQIAWFSPADIDAMRGHIDLFLSQ
ncbi:MAG: tRNA (adenosine(37)-N6)-dimethylallyltransferase MiaA [Deltaproteobacteria bacterium]|nr:tRNA (adenosine(37)-N6)-dimethylallyltransferase MiaA [Deltaproteobacteria bacterium]